MNKYLFVLSPPFSGSTVLWKLLGSSAHVSSLPGEGQLLDGVREIMRDNPWQPETRFPWQQIKLTWLQHWDTDKRILLEKSPPNLLRAFEIEEVFEPSYFVAMIRDPYAHCEGLMRRSRRSVESAVGFWVQSARALHKDIEGLQRIISLTYEELTGDPTSAADKLLAFMPELGSIDVGQTFSVHSVEGRKSRTLRNYNEQKVALLASRDIERIGSLLADHSDLMEYFGYTRLTPDWAHDCKRIWQKSKRVFA